MNPLCLRELVDVVHGELIMGAMPPLEGDLTPIIAVSLNSREIDNHDLFWGILGKHHDGSRYAEDAFRQGAIGAVVSNRQIEPWAGRFAIRVDDSQQALWRLASWMRHRFQGRLIVVNQTEEERYISALIHAVLSTRKQTAAEFRPQKQSKPLALQLLNLEEDHEYGIITVPAANRSDFSNFSHLCCPHIAVITPLLEAKDQNQEGLNATTTNCVDLLNSLPKGGWVVADGDTPFLRELNKRQDINIIWTGEDLANDIVATDIRYQANSVDFHLENYPIHIPIANTSCVKATLAAAAIGKLFDISMEQIVNHLNRYLANPHLLKEIADPSLLTNRHMLDPLFATQSF